MAFLLGHSSTATGNGNSGRASNPFLYSESVNSIAEDGRRLQDMWSSSFSAPAIADSLNQNIDPFNQGVDPTPPPDTMEEFDDSIMSDNPLTQLFHITLDTFQTAAEQIVDNIPDDYVNPSDRPGSTQGGSSSYAWDWHHPIDSIEHDAGVLGNDFVSEGTSVLSKAHDGGSWIVDHVVDPAENVLGSGFHSAENFLSDAGSTVWDTLSGIELPDLPDIPRLFGDNGMIRDRVNSVEDDMKSIVKWVLIIGVAGLFLVGYTGTKAVKGVYRAVKPAAKETFASLKPALSDAYREISPGVFRKINSAIELL